MIRDIPVRAHQRRLPDRVKTPFHQELVEAWQREKSIREGIEMLARELERELAHGEIRS